MWMLCAKLRVTVNFCSFSTKKTNNFTFLSNKYYLKRVTCPFSHLRCSGTQSHVYGKNEQELYFWKQKSLKTHPSFQMTAMSKENWPESLVPSAPLCWGISDVDQSHWSSLEKWTPCCAFGPQFSHQCRLQPSVSIMALLSSPQSHI